jgi:hypothetical protein
LWQEEFSASLFTIKPYANPPDLILKFSTTDNFTPKDSEPTILAEKQRIAMPG